MSESVNDISELTNDINEFTNESANDIKQLVDEYAKWDQLLTEAKAEIDKIKAKIQARAAEELENSKIKTVKYYGSNNNVASVGTSETVKLVSFTYLKLVLGAITGDFVKEETTHKLSDPFKRIVAPLCTGNYTEQTLDDVIRQMDVDANAAKVLRKKLRGDVNKDRKILASIGMAPEDIDHWLYFIVESLAYERIARLLKVAGYEYGTPEYDKAIFALKQALITEEGIKIGIEYEEESKAV